MILNEALLSFQMRDISTDRPTECRNGEQSYSSIIPMIAPRPEDIASKELLDALDAPRLCLEEYDSEDGMPKDMVMSVLSAAGNALILLSQHACNITMYDRLDVSGIRDTIDVSSMTSSHSSGKSAMPVAGGMSVERRGAYPDTPPAKKLSPADLRR